MHTATPTLPAGDVLIEDGLVVSGQFAAGAIQAANIVAPVISADNGLVLVAGDTLFRSTTTVAVGDLNISTKQMNFTGSPITANAGSIFVQGLGLGNALTIDLNSAVLRSVAGNIEFNPAAGPITITGDDGSTCVAVARDAVILGCSSSFIIAMPPV